MGKRRKLIEGRFYPVERLTLGKRDEMTRLQVMEYLGEFGEVYLFRHPAGYRERADQNHFHECPHGASGPSDQASSDDEVQRMERRNTGRRFFGSIAFAEIYGRNDRGGAGFERKGLGNGDAKGKKEDKQ